MKDLERYRAMTRPQRTHTRSDLRAQAIAAQRALTAALEQAAPHRTRLAATMQQQLATDLDGVDRHDPTQRALLTVEHHHRLPDARPRQEPATDHSVDRPAPRRDREPPGLDLF